MHTNVKNLPAAEVEEEKAAKLESLVPTRCWSSFSNLTLACWSVFLLVGFSPPLLVVFVSWEAGVVCFGCATEKSSSCWPEVESLNDVDKCCSFSSKVQTGKGTSSLVAATGEISHPSCSLTPVRFSLSWSCHLVASYWLVGLSESHPAGSVWTF